MAFGSIYSTTYWGNPEQNGWGNIYYPYTDNVVTRFVARVEADGGTVEDIACAISANFN